MLNQTNVKRVREQDGYVLQPGEGERLSAVGVELTFKALGGDTDDNFIFIEYEAPPNFPGPPPHWHKETTEVFCILEGNVNLTVGDEEVEAGPGTIIYVPTGVVHSFANKSDEPARFVFVATPPGLDEYFFKLMDLVAEVPEWPPDDPEKRKAVATLAREYDQYPPGTAPKNGPGKAIIHKPGDGTPLSVGGQHLNFITDAEKTGGQLTTMVYEGSADAQGPPPHYHKETAEVVYMLEGAITFNLAGRELEAGPGSFVHIPPDVVHSWRNDSGEPVKFLGFALPAGLEGYFYGLMEMMQQEPTWPPEDMSKIAKLSEEHDQYMVKQTA